MRHPAVNNPFALMLAPRQVKQAMRRSESLRQLQQRAYHLMDKPRPNADAELAAYDAALDAASPWHVQVEVQVDGPLNAHVNNQLHAHVAQPARELELQ